ncbi:MAG: glutamate--tRNA ligase [Nitrospinota bacterium]|nr:MAG: glutamate--tRNA ligase [Nitrospinota bacterium]
MNTQVRVRFAPSPTGHLHIGGVRTALFNWLFARNQGGVFILRIEDTDRSRSTEEFIAAIIEGLRWLELDWDEGPYRQTERLALYQEHAHKLLEAGKAYYCYCSPEELEQRRQEAIKRGESPRYDRRCRERKDIPAGITPAIRLKAPLEGETTYHDLVYGPITFANAQLDDLIILRSDGTPTYNFCVVVDDVTMRISHVIRGDDHINNTPRQILIYQALEYPLPQFAHVPIILGPDKSRLSKRHGATSILAYRDMGYLPEAMINYLVRLGWSHGDQEIFSREELIKYFSLEQIHKSAAIFNPEKLLWLNSHYIKTIDESRLIALVRPFLEREGIVSPGQEIEETFLRRVVASLRERAKTLVELAQFSRFYFGQEVSYEEKAARKFLRPEVKPLLQRLITALKAAPDFSEASIEQAFQQVITAEGVKLGKVAQPARVALTGGTVSPSIYEIISIIGRERVLHRLQKAIDYIESTENT